MRLPSIDRRGWALGLLLAASIGPALAARPPGCAVPRADLSANRITESAEPRADRVRPLVEGIAADGELGPDLRRLVYRLKGARRLDPRHVAVALHTHDKAITVSDDFVLDAARATLSLKPDRREAFIQRMQQLQRATLVLSLSTPGYAQVYSFSQELNVKVNTADRPHQDCG